MGLRPDTSVRCYGVAINHVALDCSPLMTTNVSRNIKLVEYIPQLRVDPNYTTKDTGNTVLQRLRQ